MCGHFLSVYFQICESPKNYITQYGGLAEWDTITWMPAAILPATSYSWILSRALLPRNPMAGKKYWQQSTQNNLTFLEKKHNVVHMFKERVKNTYSGTHKGGYLSFTPISNISLAMSKHIVRNK